MGNFDHQKGVFRGLNFAKYLDSGVNPLTTWADLPGQVRSFTAWNRFGVGIRGVIANLVCGLGDLLGDVSTDLITLSFEIVLGHGSLPVYCNA